jgi:hypothetical protein
MNNLKGLCVIIALTLVLSASAFGDDPQPAPCNPGEIHSPPCSTAQVMSDAPTPGQTSTPPSASAVTEYVVADTAIDFVESVLSLF